MDNLHWHQGWSQPCAVHYVSKSDLAHGIGVYPPGQKKLVMLTAGGLQKLIQENKDSTLINDDGSFWIQYKRKHVVLPCWDKPCTQANRLDKESDGQADTAPVTGASDFELLRDPRPKSCIPQAVPTKILGQGHLGQPIDDKTFQVVRGQEDDYFTDPLAEIPAAQP